MAEYMQIKMEHPEWAEELDVRMMEFILAHRKNICERGSFVETMSLFVAANVKEKSIQGSQAKFTWGIKNGHEYDQPFPNHEIVIGSKRI